MKLVKDFENIAVMNRVSERVQNLQESAVIKMAQQSRELMRKGNDIINLSIGEPDYNTPAEIKEAAKQAIDKNITHYPPVNGFLELRLAIAEKLERDNGLHYDAGRIVVSNGAKQSLANIFLSVLNPGDEVILPAPYWVSYIDMIKLTKAKPVILETNLQDDFKITSHQLESAITQKTKIFLLNSPANPTGTVYSKEELASFAEVVSRYPQLLIVSDEIYEHIHYTGKHHSIASFDNVRERVAVVNGVSKAFAMTGWRIGYMAGPLWLAGAARKLQGQITSGPATISQMAALEAMKIRPDKSRFLQEIKADLKEKRNLTIKLLRNIGGIQANVPQGAFYLFPVVSHYFGKSDGETVIHNSNDLCYYLLEKAGVALVPGVAFGANDNLRISYSVDKEKIITAFYRIEKALNQLH